MIGDGWNDEPAAGRPGPAEPPPQGVRRVAVVTGSRADFGLLRPVMLAIHAHPELELAVIAAGAHLIAPAETFRDVKTTFAVADAVPMQIAGKTGRVEDAHALGRGVGRFARAFDRLRPDWVLVLGDRIEAFAAASAASVGGWALAHVHGGDRAEGIADEAMRGAITKLSHLHLAATATSADRLLRMGERPEHVHAVGSPAADGLAAIPPLDDGAFDELGRPTAVLLMHPVGRPVELEEAAAASILEGLAGERILALHPNFDPGREGILRAILAAGVPARTHLPRDRFVGLLRRLADRTGGAPGALVGNSSAALIEGAILRVPAVDIGPRQAGRERGPNAVHAEGERPEAVRAAVARARGLELREGDHPYGDGGAGPRIAALLARTNPHDPALLRKRNAY